MAGKSVKYVPLALLQIHNRAWTLKVVPNAVNSRYTCCRKTFPLAMLVNCIMIGTSAFLMESAIMLAILPPCFEK